MKENLLPFKKNKKSKKNSDDIPTRNFLDYLPHPFNVFPEGNMYMFEGELESFKKNREVITNKFSK